MESKKKKRDLEYLQRAIKKHKGKWLTEEAVATYQKLASKLPADDREMTGARRKLCMQLMEEYGVTEIEATNIINGYIAYDYVAKYERIRTQTPLIIKKDTSVDSETENS